MADEARDLRPGRLVALKVSSPRLTLPPAAKEPLLQEVRAPSALDHAHLARIYEIQEADSGRSFIAMAFHAGETLLQKVARGTRPGP